MINKLKQLIFDILFRQNLVINSDSTLEDKVIMITGGSRGLGKVVASVLLNKGAKVSLMSGSFDKRIKKDTSMLTIKGDVTSARDCKSFFDLTLKKFGKIDVLINNAGIIFVKSFEEVLEGDLDKVFATNVKGTFLMCKTVVPYMKKQKSGLIINIGSKISHNINVAPKMVLYALTKYAVEGFSKALSKELKAFNIRVTCLMPGTISTFRSIHTRDHISPYNLANLISTMIMHRDIDFESVMVSSIRKTI